MAQTANTGYRYLRSLNANAADPIPLNIPIANSTTLRIGDLVRVNTSGFIAAATAGLPVGGVCVGFVDNNGVNVLGFGVGNTTGCTVTGDDQVATASDNQTRASAVYAQLVTDIAGNILWLNKADGALSQTNLFQFFDTDANARQTASGTALDTNGQLQLMILDPMSTGGTAADTTMGAFRICENQYGAGIDTGTAKVGS